MNTKLKIGIGIAAMILVAAGAVVAAPGAGTGSEISLTTHVLSVNATAGTTTLLISGHSSGYPTYRNVFLSVYTVSGVFEEQLQTTLNSSGDFNVTLTGLSTGSTEFKAAIGATPYGSLTVTQSSFSI